MYFLKNKFVLCTKIQICCLKCKCVITILCFKTQICFLKYKYTNFISSQDYIFVFQNTNLHFEIQMYFFYYILENRFVF